MHSTWFNFLTCLLAFMDMSLPSLVDGASSFHHRQYHRCECVVQRFAYENCWYSLLLAIIAGNYLYVDGGEIVTWNHSGNGVQAGYGVQGKSCFNQTCLGNITVLPGLSFPINSLLSPMLSYIRQLHLLDWSVPVMDECNGGIESYFETDVGCPQSTCTLAGCLQYFVLRVRWRL